MSVMEATKAELDGPVQVRERLEAFASEVLAEAMNRPVQMENGALYLRGLIGQGPRKSLEPIVARLGGGKVEYEALQHFLADSPWDPALVDRAVAERVCAAIEPEAWVLDDTGVPKDGKRSPGVKRQYSGTLGKIGSCQIAVSLHAVGQQGTVPLGFRLYLPEDWCADPERRKKAKIPASVEFATKPALGSELVARAAGWKIRHAPVLGDQAYGNDSKLRARLADDALDYVLSVGSETDVFEPDTVFAVPARTPGSRGRAPSALRADREPQSIKALTAGLDPGAFQTLAFRDTEGRQLVSRFAFVRVIVAHPVTNDRRKPREEWLIVESPEDHDEPTDYWISNLPVGTEPERLARLARLRWMIELDYKQLKGELGLDHYEGRSYLGFHHHCTLVTAAHGFLTLERADPNRPRPA
ncbi:MAG: IS701 family transposase [Actinobacteria bacterium]|nr:IS701 family transposase [Actinomycetota bacterium]MCA1700861.1 IS701 family transposase [Actinomycetota bacterium]